MRFATFVHQGIERFGLVVRHPQTAEDWVLDPAKIEELADYLTRFNSSYFRWFRPRLMTGKIWPRDLVGFLRLGQEGMDAAARAVAFISAYMEQGDPTLLRGGAFPLSSVILKAPIPRPQLLLGAVGNSAAFIRNDPPRGRNVHQPACHQRTQTSVLGHGQPIAIPAESEGWGGTTELGVVIGTGGRDIPKGEALHHVAGFTVINDASLNCYYQRWAELDASGAHDSPESFHFHASNTASWLSKKADNMCVMGPFLVTKDEVGNPYDLMCYYREGGVLRDRSHTGALCCGIEELIHWLSQFLTLEPGMVLHMGTAGWDGFPMDLQANLTPGYVVEAEIERVGSLRNPLVWLKKGDWREKDDPGRSVHPVPLVRDLIAAGDDHLDTPEDWHVGDVRHFWPLIANYDTAQELQGIAPRPYPMTYNTPVSALAASGSAIRLPACARTITGTCELGLVIKSVTGQVTPEEAKEHILGYVVLAVLRDSSFEDGLVQPHLLDANMPEIYNRWPDGFNIVSAQPIPIEGEAGRKMSFAVDGVGETHISTDAYLLDGARVVAELSRWITMLPGDVISLGRTGPLLTIPCDRALPDGTRVHASIEGLDQVTAILDDQRLSAMPVEQQAE